MYICICVVLLFYMVSAECYYGTVVYDQFVVGMELVPQVSDILVWCRGKRVVYVAEHKLSAQFALQEQHHGGECVVSGDVAQCRLHRGDGPYRLEPDHNFFGSSRRRRLCGGCWCVQAVLCGFQLQPQQ